MSERYEKEERQQDGLCRRERERERERERDTSPTH